MSAGCHKNREENNTIVNELSSTVPQLMCTPLGNNFSELPATVLKQQNYWQVACNVVKCTGTNSGWQKNTKYWKTKVLIRTLLITDTMEPP